MPPERPNPWQPSSAPPPWRFPREARRPPAVLVDEACIQPPETLGPKATYVAGVARLAEGMVLIHDLTTFLSASEAASLDEALPAPVTR